MKNCRKIQPELSAYLDGEVTPSLRAKIENHLATCTDCRQELSEMKMLVTGMAALPDLKPAPRFLTEVRLKIARGERPETFTWRDHIFRPIWLKVPLEIAALIMIIGLVIKSERSATRQQVARLESAGEEKTTEARENSVAAETATDGEKSTRADQVPAAEPSRDVAAAPAAKAEPSRPSLVREKEEKDVAVAASPGPAAGNEKLSLDQLASGGGDSQPGVHAKKTLAFQDNGASSATPQPLRLSILGSGSDKTAVLSKPGETVSIHGRGIEDVRSQAQRLAARCGGQVVVVPSAQNTTDQVFFVELPREYVAAFKLELMKSPGATAILARSGTNDGSDATNVARLTTGVLTGNAITNNSINAPGALGLRDDTTTPAATTVLEIRVVAPAN